MPIRFPTSLISWCVTLLDSLIAINTCDWHLHITAFCFCLSPYFHTKYVLELVTLALKKILNLKLSVHNQLRPLCQRSHSLELSHVSACQRIKYSFNLQVMRYEVSSRFIFHQYSNLNSCQSSLQVFKQPKHYNTS